jgi:chromosomal replication initiator protein
MDIGRKFGGKDHTTIMHAIRTVEALKASDAEISEDLHILSKILQS